MRFLADESCDFVVVRALRDAGHDVQTVRDILPGGTDESVIALASREGRVLLTEDKDFGRLVFASRGPWAGVVLMRFPASARATIGAVVVQVVKQAGDRIARSFSVVQPHRARIIPRSDLE